MEWKLRSPGSLRLLLLLALAGAASSSCERERQPEKPNRERPPRPKLANPSTVTVVPLADGGVYPPIGGHDDYGMRTALSRAHLDQLLLLRYGEFVITGDAWLTML